MAENNMTQDSCTVCISKFSEESGAGRGDANVLTVLTCGHTLHTACFNNIKNSGQHPKCPSCRKDLKKLTDLKP